MAIADVDALVKKGTPIDEHALTNTTSVYTSARIFPMLPERLSTDLTSLNPGEDRLALVTEMVFNADASLAGATVYRARVRNKAKLAYDAVSAWIDGDAALPERPRRVPGMEAQLRTQDALAQRLRVRRRAEGSLEFETFQPRAVFDGEQVVDIRQQVQNRARQLIEEVMIATNGCTARYLAGRGGASLRRVVRSPERWQRIVAVAEEYGETLPTEPDSKALEAFLAKRHQADPLRFPDLSLVIVQAHGLGRVRGGDARWTAHRPFWPGRARLHPLHRAQPALPRPDHLAPAQGGAGRPAAALFRRPNWAIWRMHCTRQEDAAQKVERRMRKSEAALLLESRIGQRYRRDRHRQHRPTASGCASSRRRPKASWCDGDQPRGRRQGPRQARRHRCGARLYRLCAGGVIPQTQGQDIQPFWRHPGVEWSFFAIESGVACAAPGARSWLLTRRR